MSMNHYQPDDESRRRENERERILYHNRKNKAFRTKRCFVWVIYAIVLIGLLAYVFTEGDNPVVYTVLIVLILAILLYDLAVAGRCPHCHGYISHKGTSFLYHCAQCFLFPHRCPYCGESLEYFRELEELYDHLKKAEAASEKE